MCNGIGSRHLKLNHDEIELIEKSLQKTIDEHLAILDKNKSILTEDAIQEILKTYQLYSNLKSEIVEGDKDV